MLSKQSATQTHNRKPWKSSRASEILQAQTWRRETPATKGQIKPTLESTGISSEDAEDFSNRTLSPSPNLSTKNCTGSSSSANSGPPEVFQDSNSDSSVEERDEGSFMPGSKKTAFGFPTFTAGKPQRPSSPAKGKDKAQAETMTKLEVSSRRSTENSTHRSYSFRAKSGASTTRPERSASRRPISEPEPLPHYRKVSPSPSSPPRPQSAQSVSANSQIGLSPETAIPGRIIWVRSDENGKAAEPVGVQRSWAEKDRMSGAKNHPGIILFPNVVKGDDRIVKILLITSWDGQTVDEKWNRGEGIRHRSSYLLLEHTDEETQKAKEKGLPTLALRDGKLMRKRSWVSVRDDPYEFTLNHLALFTDPSRTDSEFFLDEESFQILRKTYLAALAKRLSGQ